MCISECRKGTKQGCKRAVIRMYNELGSFINGAIFFIFCTGEREVEKVLNSRFIASFEKSRFNFSDELEHLAAL